MKDQVVFALWMLSLIAIYSCSSNRQGLFRPKTPHERYQSSLRDAGLAETAIYKAWAAAAQSSLSNPTKISAPYREAGFFPAETPQSEGFEITGRKGEKIRFHIEKRPSTGRVFSELWKIEDSLRSLLYAADTIENKWEVELKDDGTYLVRLQPELLHTVSYTLTIETGPSLAFPVRTSDNPKISSFWGDARDGGARSHEGIDIFAPKRTPVLAAADGVITRVGTNNLGGNIVFLRPRGKNYNLYYAHLDSQLVREGQDVVSGDIIGLVGNTGNARNTPPHLHFGIYSNSVAVDPFPYVSRERPIPETISADTTKLNRVFRTTQNTNLSPRLFPITAGTRLDKGTIVVPVAVAGKLLKVMLPDGNKGYIKESLLTQAPISQKIPTSSDSLFSLPSSNSPIKATITDKNTWLVYGVWREYAYVGDGKLKGWVRK